LGVRGSVRAFVATFALLLLSAPVARAAPPNNDYAATALNIIPSGQYGSVPPPANADLQAQMYDNLTPLFDQVTDADLTKYFKSEAFGSLGTDGPGTPESVPRPGVEIIRDSFNVPHVNAQTHDDGVWAAGWIAAEDRGLLLAQARYNARVAAIDVPNVTALSLITQLKSFTPTEQTEAEIAKQTDVLLAQGSEGQQVLHDIDVFISGINDYLALNSPSTTPWTRNDVYALNALKGQFLGQGGGDEARRSAFLAGLIQHLGKKKAMDVFNDLRQFKNKGLPTTIDGKFPYGHIPGKPKGSVIIDHGSYQPVSAVPTLAPHAAPQEPQQASNTLMIDRKRSATGRPLMVGGPQIGYFYPGLTYEIDMHAGDLQWRGATSVPLPGYLLIGRGPDFANTLTSASADIIDQYVERLCNGSDDMYIYKGECRPMEHVDAGSLGGQEVTFLRTVHGPVVAYATVDGERVAISSKRSSYGRDVLDQLFFRRLSNGQVHSPKTYFKAASLTPQTFNSFYIDNKHIAEYTSGLLPKRPKSLDPGLPTLGTGQYEWTGFVGPNKHPHGTNPADGTMVNWNQNVALGFGAADNEWGRMGSAARVDLLNKNLARLRSGKKWTLAEVTAAMNAGATQDIRAIDTVPLLAKLLKGSQAPSATAQQMLDVLVAWRAHGGSRLDRDLDGLIDDPGAAIMDTAWPLIADAFMGPRIGDQLNELNSLFRRFDQPPSGQYAGWYQYFDRDIRSLLGMNVPTPFNVSYCGSGHKTACQQAIWGAIEAAGQSLASSQGTPDPASWRVSALPERITFLPGVLPFTMRYTNRPTGIQQVISFSGHG
jgi:acyl-homoserine lactone acylase PvdQ